MIIGMKMGKPLASIFIATLLAACDKSTPPTLSALPPLPEKWEAPAEPLPPIPQCDAVKDVKKRLSCRAAYDTQTRSMYVDEANKRQAVVETYNQARASGVQK